MVDPARLRWQRCRTNLKKDKRIRIIRNRVNAVSASRKLARLCPRFLGGGRVLDLTRATLLILAVPFRFARAGPKKDDSKEATEDAAYYAQARRPPSTHTHGGWRASVVHLCRLLATVSDLNALFPFRSSPRVCWRRPSRARRRPPLPVVRRLPGPEPLLARTF